jgi:ATP synthase protein I
VKLLPTPKPLPKGALSGSDGIGKGAEMAVGLLVFLGIGFGVDKWLGTVPVFMIVGTVFFAVGQMIKMWYGYDNEMRRHEAARASNSRSSHMATDHGNSAPADTADGR